MIDKSSDNRSELFLYWLALREAQVQENQQQV
jgi:hypothetical protein